MVAISPTSNMPRRQGAFRGTGGKAAGGCLALLAAVLMLAGGCQPRARFAEGVATAPPAYEPRPPQTAAPEFVIPPRPQIDLPPQAGAGRFPASWSPKAAARPWKWIVIHHSATADGGAARFDKEHRNNGWDELGYHFVIGNGSDTPNGAIEVGPRWSRQKHGAHAKTPDNRFNDYGIGICVVGNFESGRPSPQQMRSLSTLVAYLMARHNIPPERVIGHDDTGRSTACPGRHLESQLVAVRRSAAQAVARGFAAPPGHSRPAMYATEQR